MKCLDSGTIGHGVAKRHIGKLITLVRDCFTDKTSCFTDKKSCMVGTGSAIRLVSDGVDNTFIDDMVPVTGSDKVQLYDGTYE
jgi:hypothetical protein